MDLLDVVLTIFSRYSTSSLFPIIRYRTQSIQYSIDSSYILIFPQQQSTWNLCHKMQSSTYSQLHPHHTPFSHNTSQSSPYSPQQPFHSHNKTVQNKQIIQTKPCQLYGLDPQKLNIQHLMKYRGYRRLYNIVAYDQASSEHKFRPNLIKELYFLLQITPFIHDQLKDRFLNKIEQWYNSNDHKKIQLSKNLDGFVKNVLQQKNKQNKQNNPSANKDKPKRPKSGIQWDATLNPFLRPYTAKIRNSNSNSHHRGALRPQSSKFGVGSTLAQTNQQKSSFHQCPNHYGDFQYQEEEQIYRNEQIDEQKGMCDIEQQWQRSQDFKKKYRTLHPQEEPTYQKLMSLISRFQQVEDGDENNYKNTFYRSNLVTNKRNIQSAIITRQNNARILAENQLNLNKVQGQKQQNNKNANDSGDDDNYDKNEQNQYNQQQVEEQDQISLTDTKGKFKSDARSRQGRRLRNKNNDNHIYTMINGVKILRPYTAKQTNIIHKLDQYSTLQQNKKVIQSNQDQQCANKYHQYVRRKTMMKKQIVRRSQSKRYMENFKNVVKILPPKIVSPLVELNGQNTKNVEQTNKIAKALNQPNTLSNRNQEASLLSRKQNNKYIFDFSLIDSAKSGALQNQRPYYNVKRYFQDVKKKRISASCRALHKLDVQSHIQGQKSCIKMTHQKRLFSQQKFDPLHKANLQNYNKEALDQIQAIKLRFNGKISASTDALIKALYVDAPLPTKLSQITGNYKNTFVIPDKKYLMIQKQQKKKKRKLRKVKNSKSVTATKTRR